MPLAYFTTKENNSELVEAKRQLDEATAEQDPTPGMTQATADNYRAKKAAAEQVSAEAQSVIDNGDATAEEIRDESESRRSINSIN